MERKRTDIFQTVITCSSNTCVKFVLSMNETVAFCSEISTVYDAIYNLTEIFTAMSSKSISELSRYTAELFVINITSEPSYYWGTSQNNNNFLT